MLPCKRSAASRLVLGAPEGRGFADLGPHGHFAATLRSAQAPYVSIIRVDSAPPYAGPLRGLLATVIGAPEGGRPPNRGSPITRLGTLRSRGTDFEPFDVWIRLFLQRCASTDS